MMLKQQSMNTSDKSVLLEHLNNQKAALLMPVIVILATLMILGIAGNSTVVYYYCFKIKLTSNSTFIISLAIFDLISCTISIPIEIIDIRYFYTFTNTGACKVMRFVNHVSSIGSALTLFAIAIDRYRHVCRPFGKQFSMRSARIACLVPLLVAFLFSWPAIILYQPVHVEVKTDNGTKLDGMTCTTVRDESYEIYLWIFNGTYLSLFVIFAGMLCVMYCLIGRVLYKSQRLRKRYFTYSKSSKSEASDSGETRPTALEFEELKNIKKYHVNIVSQHICLNILPHLTTGSEQHQRGHLHLHIDVTSFKYTMIMLTVTVVFVVSFLPYLILVVWRTFLNIFEDEILSKSELVAFQVGIRSYFINSVANPFIYGLFNPNFRHFFRLALFSCCARKDVQNKVIKSSENQEIS